MHIPIVSLISIPAPQSPPFKARPRLESPEDRAQPENDLARLQAIGIFRRQVCAQGLPEAKTTYMHVCMCVYIYIYTCTYVYIHIYICIYLRVRVYVYV